MTLGLFFGFLHHFGNSYFNFERLHIFLFNLCSGGTLILYHTLGEKKTSPPVVLFLWLAIAFAVFAFLEIYAVAIIASLLLAAIVEKTRIEKFSFFPTDFFRSSVSVASKFHQASLLCLSLGLVLSCLVMLNSQFLNVIDLPTLKLDTFFLGFSFPVSLITFSLMFSFVRSDFRQTFNQFKNIVFWIINLGVIILFLLIIFQQTIAQVIIASVLFLAVVFTFMIFHKIGSEGQQKIFLSSGMAFLLVSAVTGILYILLHFSSGYSSEAVKPLLRLHAFVSLYGWNLCGLTVICRFYDFPIRLQSKKIIAVHWVTVAVLAPLGYTFWPMALGALLLYVFVLYSIFFSQGSYSIS